MTVPAGPNIWQALAVTQAVSGGVVYIDSTGTPNIDILGLWFNPTTNALSVNTAGDYTGTDSINTYYQQDSYLPQSMVVNTADSALTAGHTVSSSQGTGQVPLVNLTQDYLGQFSGWGYTGSGIVGTNSWRRLAGMTAYAAGTTGAVNGIGGELRFGTKQDNGIWYDWYKLDNTGALMPLTASSPLTPLIAGTNKLGKASYGWSSFTLDYSNTATIGAVTINKPAGRVNIAAGQTSLVVTDSLVTANSIVLAVVAQADATAYVKNVVPGNGSFTITLGAAATANCAINFLVIGTDS